VFLSDEYEYSYDYVRGYKDEVLVDTARVSTVKDVNELNSSVRVLIGILRSATLLYSCFPTITTRLYEYS
jgi:hypothetical protein